MALLQVHNLKTYFFTANRQVKAVAGVDFAVEAGETLALVGESGSGKSMTALSLLRLVPPPGKVVEGEICFDGEDLLKLPEAEMRRLRGNRIGMIFQEPMTSLNPVFRIGSQIAEVLQLHRGMKKKEALIKAGELLYQVGIPAPTERLGDYPHQLSGGLRQRVMIAMALACNPRLLIADEPTTALDVTIQAQILELLHTLKQERQMAMLLITHDLGVVAERADRVAIMYAGLIVESAPVATLFAVAAHPYSRGLLACIPRLGERQKQLETIPGQVPAGGAPALGCPFRERCREALLLCAQKLPPLRSVGAEHEVRCWLHSEEEV
ncbi:MAG: ABC transporter ATP-binding protein [Desulfuromonas sp.]|nr:MAG: ABC transporter ATP-binding protein [Desulfuromonas sp.]